MYVAKKYSFMLAWTWLCQIDACVSHSIAEVKLVVSSLDRRPSSWSSSFGNVILDLYSLRSQMFVAG